MKLLEYQTKSFLKKQGIPTESYILCRTPDEAEKAYTTLGKKQVMVKAQVLTGGRGKAGGIQKASSIEETRIQAEKLLRLSIRGLPVQELIVSEAVAIDAEFYVSFVIDRKQKSVLLVMSREGGMDIEQVARETPDRVLKFAIDPLLGIPDYLARYFITQCVEEPSLWASGAVLLQNLYRLFVKEDASLVEINPLVVTRQKQWLAIDGKMVLDDNARFRHIEHEVLAHWTEQEKKEQEAKKKGFSYLSLDGNIGCVVNGAGLAMATLDRLTDFGGRPANFLDIGGSSHSKKVKEAMELLLRDTAIKGVFINIFGGITRCDDVAMGLLEAFKELNNEIPIVVRLTGTNEKEGKELLCGGPFLVVDEMDEAVKKIVNLVNKAG